MSWYVFSTFFFINGFKDVHVIAFVMIIVLLSDYINYSIMDNIADAYSIHNREHHAAVKQLQSSLTCRDVVKKKKMW